MKDKALHQAWIGLGTNLGDKISNLRRAIEELDQKEGKVISRSSVYESQPMGFRSDHLFFNMCIEYETSLSARDLMLFLQDIEEKMGRQKSTERYTDRLIDMDILLYDSQLINTDDLIVPHPRLHERAFVLYPLAEISPFLVHPLMQKDIQSLLEVCPDENEVRRLLHE